jgi:triosephosphate isomerase (TIM)
MADRGPRPLVAGNWKMNGTMASLDEVGRLMEMLSGARVRCDVMICPPATLIAPMVRLVASSPIEVGGQDCHSEAKGAHTGDISAEMLSDAGCSGVIVGHSERRADHGETDSLIRDKAAAAHRAGLTAIICIGETLEEREAGRTLDVVTGQLDGVLPPSVTGDDTVLAYEPVWAIGTGLTPSLEQVAEVHGAIRARLRDRLGGSQGDAVAILYGGSVKPDNASDLMGVANVDGALVGGASLKAADFMGIIRAYE